jgi:hypothetical protein
VGEAQARAKCSSNLKMLGMALHDYHSAYGAFPSGTVPNPALGPERRLGWMVSLFHFFEQGISLVIDLDGPWNSDANRKPLLRMSSVGGDPPPYTVPADAPPWLVCPAHRPRAARGVQPAGYVGIAGVGPDAPALPTGHPRAGIFGYDRRTRVEDVTDGTAHTLMLVDTAAPAGPWTAGGPATVRAVDPAKRPYIGPGRPFGGAHRGVAAAAMADGSVRFLSQSIDPRVFEALATAAGHEALPADWDR